MTTRRIRTMSGASCMRVCLPADPVGPRAIALMRRVRAEGGRYRCQRNADREAAGRCEMAGYIRRDRRDEEVLHLTDAGMAHLDKLVRAF